MTKEIQKKEDIKATLPKTLPVLPLRDLVVFPHMVIPLPIGREGTLSAIDEVMNAGRLILLVAQKDPGIENPKAKDLFRVGVLGRIVQILKLPNGLAKVLIEGVIRVKILRFCAARSPPG